MFVLLRFLIFSDFCAYSEIKMLWKDLCIKPELFGNDVHCTLIHIFYCLFQFLSTSFVDTLMEPDIYHRSVLVLQFSEFFLKI